MADHLLASTPPAGIDNVPALIGHPLAPLVSTPLAEFRLEAEDLGNNPITNINVGQDFKLAAFVTDLRDSINQFPGVWAAFMTVAYEPNLVSIASTAHDPATADSGIGFGTYFNGGLKDGDVSTPLQIVGAGAASLQFSGSGIGPVLLWRITVHADAGGMAFFEPSFDSSPDHESAFINPPDVLTADQIQFTRLELPITGPSSVLIAPAVSQNEGNSGGTSSVLTAEVDGHVAAPAIESAGANQAITTDPGVQQMPSVAVDPLDPNHVVIVYMDYSLISTGYAGIRVAVSRDGGGHWEKSSVTLPQEFGQGAANPIVKFDNDGHVFVSFMAATFLGEKPSITNPDSGQRALGHQANNGIFVSKSDDGGMTWRAPVAVASHLFDGEHRVLFDVMPDLAIDTFRFLPDGTTPNPNYSKMYEVWARFYPPGQYPGEPDATGGSNIMIAVSTDGGQTWNIQTESQPSESSEPVTAIFNQGAFDGLAPEGKGYETWPRVTVGPEGDVYVSQFIGALFGVHHSSDGGASFTHPDPMTSALYPFGNNYRPFPVPLPANQFRVQSVRAIVADPTRPGTIYVAEGTPISDAGGQVMDQGDVIFARSADYGATWQTTFQIDSRAARVINDDNGGTSASGLEDDVADSQAMPRLVIDAQGNVALIWYDTRRDPADHLLDVYGSVSTDGGLTFSRNFRLSDQSFDADDGRFTSAAKREEFYLGDTIGLALAEGEMYAAWTDTRQGNQDVFFSRLALDRLPAPPNDRFEPNDSPETATRVGPDPIFNRSLPRLTLAAGEDDWFEITPPTALLSVTAESSDNAANLQLQLFAADGISVPASTTSIVDPQGDVTRAQILKARVVPGQTYRVRVHSTAEVGSLADDIGYSLTLSTVTANLGEVVHQFVEGEFAEVDQAYYLVQSKVAGSLRVAFMGDPGFQGVPTIEVSDLQDPDVVLANRGGSSLVAIVSVEAGQQLLVHVTGPGLAAGSFQLELTNFDQFSFVTPDKKTLFFPAGQGPSESALADLNGDGALDIVVSHVGQDVISVLMNNSDGTYGAPRDFAVGAFQQGGPFTLSNLPNFHRDLAIADFNRDGFLDLVVVNTSSSDISVLLGNGDGTFQPQRRFDATAAPFAMAVGLVNGDDIPDVVVLDSTASSTARVAVLLGRDVGPSDVSFQQPIFFSLPNRENNRTPTLLLVDVNGDGITDLVERDFFHGVQVMLGNGDGTFQLGASPFQGNSGPGLALADLDGDGKLAVVTTRSSFGDVLYTLGNGDGTFQATSTAAPTGQFPVAVAVADFAAVQPDGSIVVGVSDGHLDLIVANNGLEQPTFSGPAEVVLLPGLVDGQGHFAGFGDPLRLAPAQGPLDVKLGDLNGDEVPDVVVLDRGGILVIFGRQPMIQRNDAPETARNLGTVVHVVEPTLTVVPGHTDAYYKVTVPNEAYAGAGDQILDFSGGFTSEDGAGLMMEVFDTVGHLLGAGARFRVRAAQGTQLLVHIFGADDTEGVPGTGAYTLVIDTLAQVAGVEAHSFLPGQDNQPGGPTTSIVLVFQGDRLDSAAAEDPANYHVIWLGPDGAQGTSDDQEVPIGKGLAEDSRAMVYDAGSNIDVASGRAYPTAVRQTVTLLFGQALPVGSYRIEVSGKVTSDAFNEDELGLLSEHAGFTGHPVVTIAENLSGEGAVLSSQDLVLPTGELGAFTVFERGTRFLTQFHNDLGALLDAQLTEFGDGSFITENLLAQIVATFSPALGPVGQRLASLLVIFLDPVSIGLVDPEGRSFTYDLQKNQVAGSLSQTFVQVGGNVEVVVIPNPGGTYGMSVADVPARARGGAVYLGDQAPEIRSFTEALRSGTSEFSFSYGSPPVSPSPGPIAPPVDTGIGAILSGLAALRSMSPQALSAMSLSDISSAITPRATGSSLSPASSSSAAPRASSSGGSTRQASVDPLQVIGEMLSDIWRGMVRRIVRGLQGGSAAQADDKPDDSPLLPMWRTMTRILDRMLESNGSRSSAGQQRAVNDPKETPTDVQRNNPDQATRYRVTDRFEASAPEMRTSGASWAAESEGRPTPNAHSHQQSDEPAATTDSSPGPAESSTHENATSGSGSNAAAT